MTREQCVEYCRRIDALNDEMHILAEWMERNDPARITQDLANECTALLQYIQLTTLLLSSRQIRPETGVAMLDAINKQVRAIMEEGRTIIRSRNQ